jgi:ATP/maltotriose-dependent transcriptional regulator MalT
MPTYIEKLLAAIGNKDSPSELPEPLTARETQVLVLIAAGLSNQEIADELVVALGTAKKHVANILGKLNADNRTEAVAKARDFHLIH